MAKKARGKTTAKKKVGRKTVPAAPRRKKAARKEEPVSSASLDQVRNILFGEQVDATDSRLASIEERVDRELERLRNSMDRRLATLERRAAKEAEATARRLDRLKKTLEAKLERRCDGLAEELDVGFEELNAAKADATVLSTLFRDAAARVGKARS